MRAWALWVSVLLGSVHSWAGEPKAEASMRWAQMDELARAAELERLSSLSLPERLLAASRGFLGTRYLESPLGEGEGKDPDPLLRYDAVDCLTFVEQTMALALSPRYDQVLPTLSRIRYAEQTVYADRNHLMEAAWLPNNVRKGFLRDVTGALGGSDVQVVTKELTRLTWSSKTSAALDLPRERQVVGRFSVPMVPLEKALEKAKRARGGTVMIVIRDERPLLPTRVSHLGFIVPGKRIWLRHASKTFGQVVDEDLESFLLRQSRYTKKKVMGVAFYEVVDGQAELSAH